jgi:hypothetical protein
MLVKTWRYEVLVLEDSPEALGTGVVEARARSTHRAPNAEGLKELDDVVVGELG